MRTLNDITNDLKARFVGNGELVALYGLEPDKTFDEQFSKVSFESLIINIVALACWLVEQTFATTSNEVDAAIDARYVASIPWYRDQALGYQHGHDLTYIEATRSYGYATDDPDARIVTYAAAREVKDDNDIQRVQILVSKAEKEPLTDEEFSRFSYYMRRIAPAGSRLDIVSKASDKLQISAQVNYNPLLLTSEGRRISDGTSPVAEAIENYINAIKYGGVFNKTKLTDAIQGAEGVTDVILRSVHTATADGAFIELDGNSYASTSGSFVVDDLTISYLAAYEN
ncbi:MAG: hypothetical protein IJX68_01995 [Rikenellaceae bacterium]|nr:hypothetical protein [Rikenellaceae bacterium]